MMPSKEEQFENLLEDVLSQVDDIRVYKSPEAAKCAIVNLAQLLVLLEDME